MAPLSQASAAALARFRAYKAPSSSFLSVPLSRRAAVLILLYADRKGDLRVVLTMRASTLSSFPGQAAFPGGKADSEHETAFEIARREASEEIGLPSDDKKLPPPFRVEHLCQLPLNLAKTELVVRPCVVFLHSHNNETGKSAEASESLIPRLDAKEVAAVFSAPFHNFLKMEDELSDGSRNLPGVPSDWYQGAWTGWHQSKWRMHNFFVPITDQVVTKPRKRSAAVDQLEEVERETQRYRVWGMTARILVDAARVAYAPEEPEFEHNSHFGDEDMIERLLKSGRLSKIKKKDDELKREDMEKAAKM